MASSCRGADVSTFWPSASRAEDAAALALADVVVAATGIEYRVIGGNMAALHAMRFESRFATRATTDADAGIEPSVAAATSMTKGLTALGYSQLDGSRFHRDDGDLELVVDLLVSDVVAGQHNVEVGPLVTDAAPGLALALARPAVWVEVTVVTTSEREVPLRLPLPDSAVAVVMKTLTWSNRVEDKDAIDVFRLLDVWKHDHDRSGVQELRAGSTAARVVEVLERYFIPPAGKARLLSRPDALHGRQLAAEFVVWIRGDDLP